MIEVKDKFSLADRCVMLAGDCNDCVKQLPDNCVQLVVTSPPYNIGKEYETKVSIEDYIAAQEKIVTECFRVLKDTGSICWQVGAIVEKGELFPIDTLLYPVFKKLGFKLRNRIIWHFEHGLHARKKFSGRYETILWLTKSDKYTFNLDPVRVPQKYPGKTYTKGPKKGQLSCNPLGCNPSDVWDVPNVKSHHIEETAHPAQFPVELVERLVLSMTQKDDWVYDPFVGSGTTLIAALMHGRKAVGSEMMEDYVAIAKKRITLANKGELFVRPMGKPVQDPAHPSKKVCNKLVNFATDAI